MSLINHVQQVADLRRHKMGPDMVGNLVTALRDIENAFSCVLRIGRFKRYEHVCDMLCIARGHISLWLDSQGQEAWRINRFEQVLKESIGAIPHIRHSRKYSVQCRITRIAGVLKLSAENVVDNPVSEFIHPPIHEKTDCNTVNRVA